MPTIQEQLKKIEKDMEIQFNYEYVEKQEDVRKHIQECEGRHTQQAIYSTFHDALTQICFGCKRVRSSLFMLQDNKK